MIELLRAVRAPFVFAATLLVCITIHEVGHVLATLATGGRVKSVSILSLQPHVRVQGKFTEADNAVKSVAGSALFLAVWAGFAFVLPRGYSGLLEVRATGAFFALIEMLGWALSCLTYPQGPKSYDSWKFIQASGADPSAVVGICLLLMVGIVFLYRSRTCNSYTKNVSILPTPHPSAVAASGDESISPHRISNLAA